MLLSSFLPLALALGAVAPPANDDCAAARSIPSLPFSHSEPALALAARAADDPSPTCTGGRTFNSVWFRYTPSSTARVILSTLTSRDDTFLWVGTGSCGSFTPIACSDDGAGAYSSEVQFLAEAGTTYHVVAGSVFPVVRGQLEFRARAGDPLDGPPPANDACVDAIAIASLPQVLTATGYGATEELTDLAPPCWPGADNYTLWYSFTSPVDRQIRLDSTNSTQSTWLTVATGRCDALQAIDCDWTSGVNGHGVVDFLARAGVTYRIQVSRLFPPAAGDVVEIAASDGQSVPIAVQVRDSISGQPLARAHVQVRDVFGGYYLIREGWTDPQGRLDLFVVAPDVYSLQVVARGHQVWSEPFSMGSTPLSFDVALPPMGSIRPLPDEPTRIVMPVGPSLVHFRPDGSDRKVIALPGFLVVRFPTWSPDAREIGFMGYEASVGNNEIWVVGADGSGLRRVTRFRGLPETQVNLAWSPDGAEFAFDAPSGPFGMDRVITVVDAATGLDRREYELGSRPRWSPDSSMIAYLDAWGPRVMRRDGSNVATLNEWTATGFDWSADGTRLAISNGNTDIWTVPIEAGAALKISATEGNTQIDPIWSPDSCEVAYLDRELGITYWNVAQADGQGFRSPMPLVAWAEADWARAVPPPDTPGDRSPSVEILDPAGGELLRAGQPYTIRMRGSDDLGIVSRDLYLIENGVETPIALGLPGPLDDYLWMVDGPPIDSGAFLRVEVRDAAGQTHSVTGEYAFSIAGPSDPYHAVRLTAPRAGDVHRAGDVLRIAWDFAMDSPFTLDGFHLELSFDGGNTWRNYVYDFVPPTDRAYDWLIPEYAAGEAAIRIRAAGAYDTSGPFTIGPGIEGPGGGAGLPIVLLGARAGADAVFEWSLPGSTVNVHRTDTKGELPGLWAAPPRAARAIGTWSDPDPAPGPAWPWLYQVFATDCAGNSRP